MIRVSPRARRPHGGRVRKEVVSCKTFAWPSMSAAPSPTSASWMRPPALIRIEKTASTPRSDRRHHERRRPGPAIDLSEVALFSHGTTVATNALITRRLPRTAMVCTKGFRDVIEIRRANKEDLWDTYKDVRQALCAAPRPADSGRTRRRRAARSSAARRGGAREVARILKRRGVAAVAVCFMNAYVNGANEQRMKRHPAEETAGYPGLDLLGGACRRSSSTSVSPPPSSMPSLSPVVVDYTTRLGERLAEAGYKRDLLLLHTRRRRDDAARASRISPARLAGSGIAAGAIASRHIAGCAAFRIRSASTWAAHRRDVSLAYEGQSRVTKDWYVEFGYPIRFPSIEVLTIGAGGGSLAWIDEAGSLAQRPAIGRRQSRAPPATATATGSRPIPTPTSCSVGSAPASPAARSRSSQELAARGGRGRRRKAVRARPARGGGRHHAASPTPTCRMRCG